MAQNTEPAMGARNQPLPQATAMNQQWGNLPGRTDTTIPQWNPTVPPPQINTTAPMAGVQNQHPANQMITQGGNITQPSQIMGQMPQLIGKITQLNGKESLDEIDRWLDRFEYQTSTLTEEREKIHLLTLYLAGQQRNTVLKKYKEGRPYSFAEARQDILLKDTENETKKAERRLENYTWNHTKKTIDKAIMEVQHDLIMVYPNLLKQDRETRISSIIRKGLPERARSEIDYHFHYQTPPLEALRTMLQGMVDDKLKKRLLNWDDAKDDDRKDRSDKRSQEDRGRSSRREDRPRTYQRYDRNKSPGRQTPTSETKSRSPAGSEGDKLDRSKSPESSKGGRSPSPAKCFTCGKTGHFKRDCKQAKLTNVVGTDCEASTSESNEY
jgi:hypothetical protein